MLSWACKTNLRIMRTTFGHRTPGERIGSAALTAVLVGLIGWALVVGLRVGMGTRRDAGIALFDATLPPPPPKEKVERRPTHSHKREGRAAPPNLKSRATPLVAPVPVIPPPAPSPMITAPVAFDGAQASQGAAPVRGPGTGAGGIGDGTGSGGSGDGDGDGGDDTPPRRIKGRLKDSDYPRGAAEAGAGGTVSVRYAVEVDGRVTRCRITRSSGNIELDNTTCRLIEQRFRYRPSLDASGRPVRSWMVVDHDWEVREEPAAGSRGR